MNSLKSLVMLVVLGGIGYGVWLALTGAPDAPPPVEAPPGWGDAPPAIEMGEPEAVPTEVQAMPVDPNEPPPAFQPAPGGDAAAPSATSGEAPPFEAGAAPPFAPGAAPEATMDASAPVDPVAGAPPVGQATPADDRYADRYADRYGNAAPTSAYDAAQIPPDSPAPTVDPTGTPGTANTSAASGADFQAAMNALRYEIEQGRLTEVHLALSQWYDNPNLTGEEHQQLMELLDPVAGTVVYSAEHLLEPAYVVQPGDTLDKIAAPYQVPAALLAKINGIADPNQLQPGTQLKMIRGPFDAVIDLDEMLMTIFVQGRYAGRFRIGIGQDQATPTGEFVVQNKVENPVYNGPEGTIAADDPANPLGERWLDLGNHLGIHGTNDPESVGRAESRGCIRMMPQDVVDVYDILTVGSRVVIRR